MIRLEPLGDMILVQPRKADEETKSGLFIPQDARERPQEGTVVAVGPGKSIGDKFVETSLTVGCKVLHGKYSGSELQLDGVDYLMMREDEVFGILKDVAGECGTQCS